VPGHPVRGVAAIHDVSSQHAGGADGLRSSGRVSKRDAGGPAAGGRSQCRIRPPLGEAHRVAPMLRRAGLDDEAAGRSAARCRSSLRRRRSSCSTLSHTDRSCSSAVCSVAASTGRCVAGPALPSGVRTLRDHPTSLDDMSGTSRTAAISRSAGKELSSSSVGNCFEEAMNVRQPTDEDDEAATVDLPGAHPDLRPHAVAGMPIVRQQTGGAGDARTRQR